MEPARRAVAAVRTRSLEINVLMVLAVAGALAIGEGTEAASVVFLFALAQWLEARTLKRARHAIRALLDLAPREALVRRGGHDERVPVESVGLGEITLVRPGDRVPNVGVAMGAVGSDVALETSDLALMGDGLTRLPYVLRLARATVRTIRANIALSLLVKSSAQFSVGLFQRTDNRELFYAFLFVKKCEWTNDSMAVRAPSSSIMNSMPIPSPA